MRQRGIGVEKRGNFVSLTDVSGCENPLNQHAAQRGVYGNTCRTLQLNPSLTFRVMMVANAQLQKASVSE